MPRPRKCRRVRAHSGAAFFKPQGVPMRDLRVVVLPLDGLEALRLVDVEGLEQGAAAERMGVSRPTLSRVLAAARTTVATALVQGAAIRIATDDDAPLTAEDTETATPFGAGHRHRRGHCQRVAAIRHEHPDEQHMQWKEDENDAES